MNPFSWLADTVLTGLIYAFNWTSDNMSVGGVTYTALGSGYIAARLIRGWWPNPARRPRWAAALHNVCSPIDTTVTGLLQRFGRSLDPGKPLRRRKGDR
jgi:hypothetical protein